ncbi:MAG: hypothetical protein M0Q92_07575 [Methanoregula sp.]|nr:hypothetical protein [Methanoregula sp.]
MVRIEDETGKSIPMNVDLVLGECSQFSIAWKKPPR